MTRNETNAMPLLANPDETANLLDNDGESNSDAKPDAMITHYGLFWSERDVYWGRGGGLLGRAKARKGKKGAPTKEEREDYHDYKAFIGLYCLYGEGELIYIGEAGLDKNSNLFSRLKQHRNGAMSGRWDRFSWFGRKGSDGQANVKASLGQLEAIAIAIINPGFNKQSGTFSGATQIGQWVHPKAEGDLETKLKRITKMLEDINTTNPQST